MPERLREQVRELENAAVMLGPVTGLHDAVKTAKEKILRIASELHGLDSQWDCSNTAVGWLAGRLWSKESEGEIELRPAVVWFAQLMERKLRACAWKGGWEELSLGTLAAAMREEVAELDGALDALLTDDGPTNLHAVAQEAADVANFAMMIADVAQARMQAKEADKP